MSFKTLQQANAAFCLLHLHIYYCASCFTSDNVRTYPWLWTYLPVRMDERLGQHTGVDTNCIKFQLTLSRRCWIGLGSNVIIPFYASRDEKRLTAFVKVAPWSTRSRRVMVIGSFFFSKMQRNQVSHTKHINNNGYYRDTRERTFLFFFFYWWTRHTIPPSTQSWSSIKMTIMLGFGRWSSICWWWPHSTAAGHWWDHQRAYAVKNRNTPPVALTVIPIWINTQHKFPTSALVLFQAYIMREKKGDALFAIYLLTRRFEGIFHWKVVGRKRHLALI